MDISIRSQIEGLDNTSVSVCVDDDVKDVLDKICDDNNMTHGSIALVYDDKVIDDEFKMSKLGIGNADTIWVNVSDEITARCELTKLGMEITSDHLLDIVKNYRYEPYIIKFFTQIPNMFESVDADGDDALAIAVKNSRLDYVEIMYDSKYININHFNRNNQTAIVLAARHDGLDIMKLLCRIEGIYINGSSYEYDDDIMTTVECAAMYGNYEIVEYLCSVSGIWMGQSLPLAAERGDLDMVKLLHKNGYEIRYDCDSYNALIYASNGGHLDTVKYLCEMDGVDVNVRDYDKCTPLDMATMGGHLDVVKYLCNIDGIDVNYNGNGRSALMAAAGDGYLDVVKYLCSIEDVDHDVVDYDGNNALVMAAIGGHIDIVRYLNANRNL